MLYLSYVTLTKTAQYHDQRTLLLSLVKKNQIIVSQSMYHLDMTLSDCKELSAEQVVDFYEWTDPQRICQQSKEEIHKNMFEHGPLFSNLCKDFSAWWLQDFFLLFESKVGKHIARKILTFPNRNGKKTGKKPYQRFFFFFLNIAITMLL